MTAGKSSKAKRLAIDILYDFIGASIYALGIHSFTVPNNIAPGGVTGLSTIINHFIGSPIGLTGFIINIPLLFMGLKFLGKKFTIKTLKSVVILSFTIDVIFLKMPVYLGDPILAALFGGVCTGVGLGTIFLRGSTTGGTDIVSRLIHLKYPHVSLGKLLLCIDAMVVILAVFTFRNIETALYAFITMFVSSRIIDALIYGVDRGKLILIVSPHAQEITQKVIESMNRGATILKAVGAYSSEERHVIMCAIRNPEFYQLKQIVNEIDPTAFMIVTEAGEVIGEGFKSIEEKH